MKLSDARLKPNVALAVSLALWLVSLALPALNDGGPAMRGYEVLLLGWLGPLTATFAWYGNLFWIACSVFMAMGRAPPLALGAIGLVLAATCLGGVTVADDSGTSPATLTVGAYIWLASFLPPIAARLMMPVRFPPPTQRSVSRPQDTGRG